MSEIIDALRRDGDSSNTVIGIVILVLLTVFVAPEILPQLVAETLPFVDEGLPCTLVMNSQDPANHQSLIARGASDPLELQVDIGSYPTNGTSPLVLRVIVINNTIGSVPFVFNPNQVILNDDPSSSGIGLIFTPAFAGSLDYDGNGIANARIQGQNSFARTDIKILGPRQRCVHRVEIPNAQLANLTPGSRVRAYYRIQTAGGVQQINPFATPIFSDQGLNVVSGGFVESADQFIPFAASANTGQ